MRVVKEREFQSAVERLAETCGWMVYHTHDSRRSQPGFPDICMVKNRRIVFAELKVGNRKLTPKQKEWLEALRQTSAEVYVWRDCDWRSGVIDRVLMRS